MLEDLWKLDGEERLKAIDELTIMEIEDIHDAHRKCLRCPLALLYEDRNGIERLMCVDVATRRRVENALREGGRFVKKGEF